MNLSDMAAGVAGLAIILVVTADIFRSLLVPRANTRVLRLGPALGGVMFPVWRMLVRFVPGDQLKQTLRASLAPLLLVLSLLIWAALLIVGFGLVFWADRVGMGPRVDTLGDAIYTAGSAFGTLDIPSGVTGPLGRVAAVVCALAGLAIVTVVATFLISVQSGFGRRETLVLRLESHVSLPPAGIAILETYAREGIVERLAAFFDAWEQWAAEVAISHRAYPVLLFFRSNDSRCEWLAALGAVMDAAALLDATVDDAPPGARAAAHFLLRTGTRLVHDLAHQIAEGVEGTDTVADAARFDAHRARIAAAGYALRTDRDDALARFTTRRCAFAPALSALARRLAIDVDERRGGDADSAPLP